MAPRFSEMARRQCPPLLHAGNPAGDGGLGYRHDRADIAASGHRLLGFLLMAGLSVFALISRAELKIYENAPHGLMLTHVDRLNADLEMFIKGS